MERKDFQDTAMRRRNKGAATVRDQLLRLHQAVEAAESSRRAYLTQLRLNGYTLRQIGDVLGIAPSTVMRWAPIESDGQSPSLDDPVEAIQEEEAA
jgi:DNA-directed RNA polymerase specialized sigma24 family protein